MIRKNLTIVDETHQEAGQEVHPPARKAPEIGVMDNPLAGRLAPQPFRRDASDCAGYAAGGRDCCAVIVTDSGRLLARIGGRQ